MVWKSVVSCVFSLLFYYKKPLLPVHTLLWGSENGYLPNARTPKSREEHQYLLRLQRQGWLFSFHFSLKSILSGSFCCMSLYSFLLGCDLMYSLICMTDLIISNVRLSLCGLCSFSNWAINMDLKLPDLPQTGGLG